MKHFKRFLIASLLSGFAITMTQAQNYYIDFTASGVVTTLDSIFVENLTQSTFLTLQGSDTLHLFGTVGLASNYNDDTEFKIYPNPFNESSRMKLYSKASTVVVIDVYDVVGKHILQLREEVLKGTNVFEISGFSTGHYHLSVKTENQQKSVSFVSLNTGSQNPQILHKSSFLEDFQIKSTSKGTKNTVPMPYIIGDELRFTGFSDTLSAIVNDVPTSSKTIDFVFTAFLCGDSVTFIYDGATVTYGTVTSADGRCWLDRNLGASQVATSSTDAAAFGDLFQWGRASDGHQLRTSGTTNILSSDDVPGHSDFIMPYLSPYDWRDPQNGGLWQGVNGINNPCPPGWRVPTNTEFEVEYLSWSTEDAIGAFDSPLKLTMAGLRNYDNGMIDAVNMFGTYWSSTSSATQSYYLLTGYLPGAGGFAGVPDDERALGFSVRCIKD